MQRMHPRSTSSLGFYTPGSDEVLATAAAVEAAFSDLYKINQNANTTGLGTAIGRYPEDTYNGVGNSQGNPVSTGKAVPGLANSNPF